MQVLYAESANIDDVIFAALVGDGTSISGCTHMRFCHNAITGASARLLAAKMPRRLSHLALSHTPLGDDGAEAIAAALCDYRRVPAVAAIGSLIGMEAHRIIEQYVEGASSLKILQLDQCMFWTRGLSALETALSLNTTLGHVSVRGAPTNTGTRFRFDSLARTPPAARARYAYVDMTRFREMCAQNERMIDDLRNQVAYERASRAKAEARALKLERDDRDAAARHDLKRRKKDAE